jgi:hypothetical protein
MIQMKRDLDALRRLPNWETRVVLEATAWPKWVPRLEEDELEFDAPQDALMCWLMAVFPVGLFEEAELLVRSELCARLIALYCLGIVDNSAWRCAKVWNATMERFGYTVEADDWR